MRLAKEVEERFFKKVRQDGDCWLWTGATNQYGYGGFAIDGKRQQAHRVAYEFMVADIPEGLVIDHLCRVRNCVNPYHMEPVTIAVNLARGKHHKRDKGMCPHGHEMSTVPTRTRARRVCLTCERSSKRRSRLKAREAASSVGS